MKDFYGTPSFITLGDAAAMLLGAGFTVKLGWIQCAGFANKSRTLDVEAGVVAIGYRDGATWKFKTETIQDFIDGNTAPEVAAE